MNISRISNSVFVASINAVPASQIPNGDTDWFPAVDVTDTGQEYVFDVDLPGLKLEEIQLCVDSAGVSISGQRLPGANSVTRLRVERPSGAFIRQLPLPPDATDEVLGSFCDGVLELRIPKARHNTESEQATAVQHEPKGSPPQPAPC